MYANTETLPNIEGLRFGNSSPCQCVCMTSVRGGLPSHSYACVLSAIATAFVPNRFFRCRCGGLLVCAPYEKSHPRRVKTNRQKVLCLNWKRNWSKRTRTEIQKKRLTAVFAYFVVNWFGFLFRCEKFESYTSDGKYGEKNRVGKTRQTSESGQFFLLIASLK